MQNNREITKKYYYCYSSEVYTFMKRKGFFALFVGKANQGSTVAIFEKTDEFKKALKEYTKSESQRLWD